MRPPRRRRALPWRVRLIFVVLAAAVCVFSIRWLRAALEGTETRGRLRRPRAQTVAENRQKVCTTATAATLGPSCQDGIS